MDMVNVVKSKIDAMRQQFRDRVPKILAAQFSTKLKRQKWEQMFEGIQQTDLVTLGRDQALELLKDLSKLPAQIKAAEADLTKLGGKLAPKYQGKAKALAHWMVTREAGSNHMQTNAHAIAMLAGEKGRIGAKPSEGLVQAIDKLTTLYALDQTNQETKDSLQELANTESDGMMYVIGNAASTKGIEQMRNDSGPDGEVARLNAWKGYAPISASAGNSVIVRDDIEQKDLESKGYVRVKDYIGSREENYRGERGVYQSTVGTQASFKQGIAQTVHQSWSGVDPVNGKSQGAEFAGWISGNKAKRIRKDLTVNDTLKGPEQLVPRFGKNGEVVAYERTIAAKDLEPLKQNKHMGQVLGVWAGRLLEEELSNESNRNLITVLKNQWDEAVKSGNTKDFVNVADKESKDSVTKDAWQQMGHKMKEDAEDIFGEPDTLWVRKDLEKDAIGFREASVRDAWTGVTRWSPEAQEAAQTAATLVMGKNAYRNAVWAEDIVRSGVAYAKETIVVRSMVIIRDNLVSNKLNLMLHGIGPVQMVKQTKAKFLEVNQYVKNKERIDELNVELAAKLNQPKEARRIRAELQVLEDALDQTSLKPLLDAGEFSTIAEDMDTGDREFREGRLKDFFEMAADKVPGIGQTAFKNLIISKDTALYKGLNRAVQYSDFIDKAILYEHLMKTKGKTHEEALNVVKEEFINYNRLAGRGRSYAESIGLLWFYNFKLRSMKILVRRARENPLSLLLVAGGAGPTMDVDTVYDGSGLGVWMDESYKYSVGTGMGFDAWTMNPWYNAMN